MYPTRDCAISVLTLRSTSTSSRIHQTMVDSWYCLDPVVLERMSQVSKRSEVVFINGAPSTPLLAGTSHVPRGLTEIAEAKQVRKTNQNGILYHFKKQVQKSILTC